MPNLTLPNKDEQTVGLWGQRHLTYLKHHRKVLYYNLLTSGKLNDYLADIDKQAEKRFEDTVKTLAENEGVTKKLKAATPMEWVRRMNNIRNRATEMINSEIIYQ